MVDRSLRANREAKTRRLDRRAARAPILCRPSTDVRLLATSNRRLRGDYGPLERTPAQALFVHAGVHRRRTDARSRANPTDVRITAQQPSRDGHLRFLHFVFDAAAFRTDVAGAIRDGRRRWEIVRGAVRWSTVLSGDDRLRRSAGDYAGAHRRLNQA